jgi:hypothetical protein
MLNEWMPMMSRAFFRLQPLCLVVPAIMMLFSPCLVHAGTDYFVSPRGSDENAGTSREAAWATVERVNALTLRPGDRVLFEGGERFDGTLVLGEGVQGTDDARIVISSFGDGRATIHGGAGDGIRIDRAQYLDIRNINVQGDGRKDGNENGRGIFPTGARHLRIEHVEATGFQRAGIEFQGCHDLHISHVYAHDNGYAGISSGPERIPWSTEVYIGHSRAINNPGHPGIANNHSGNGIVLYRVDGGLVEFNEAANNGWDMPRKGNGPVGIWVAYCKHVTIQFNISHNNKTSETGGDGGGFDLDGGSENCILQYNYSYNNYGAGILVMTWSEQFPTRGNIIRYNITENDDHHPVNNNAGIFIWGGEKGFTTDNHFYNNVVFNRDGRHGISGYTSPCSTVRNNIFILEGEGSFVHKGFDTSIGEGLFQGNLYWNMDGKHKWEDEFDSLDAWREATGKEMLDGSPVGVNLDPLLNRPGNGERLTDPTRLPELFAYMLQPGSPAIDAGVDFRKLGVDPGPHDFFGNPIPRGSGFNIGAHEAATEPDESGTPGSGGGNR